MSRDLQEEEELLKAAQKGSEPDKKNVTYFLSKEVVKLFNEIVPKDHRGAMIETLMRQFIRRRGVRPISSAPRLLSGEEGEE